MSSDWLGEAVTISVTPVTTARRQAGVNDTDDDELDSQHGDSAPSLSWVSYSTLAVSDYQHTTCIACRPTTSLHFAAHASGSTSA